MAYQNFNANEIFVDPKINTYCDAFLSFVLNELEYDHANIALSGQAADWLQGGKTLPIRAIIFVTDDQQIFKNVASKFSSRFTSAAVVRFKDHITFYFGDYLFELWSLSSLTTVEASNIKCQTAVTIPQNLL